MERHLAKIGKNIDLVIEGHGFMIPLIDFDYEDFGVQGLPMILGRDGADFLRRLLRAVGVFRFSALAGKSCWVTHDDDTIHKIEPLHKGDGEPFDIKDWREECQKENHCD